jgi:hypothetical protein
MSYSQFLRKSPLPTFNFPECLSCKEDPLPGNMRPTFHHLFINRWSVLGSPKFPYWGNGDQFCLIDENGVSEMCFLNPYRASNAVDFQMCYCSSRWINMRVPRAAISLEDFRIQICPHLGKAICAKSLRATYNNLIAGSQLLLQQSKWPTNKAIPSNDVTYELRHCITILAQKRCTERAALLRRTIP